MKKLLILALLFSSPAWADDIQSLEAKIDRQQQEIDSLTKRVEMDENINHGVSTQIISMIKAQERTTVSSPSITPQETPAQSWQRIHSETQHEEMEQDIDANRHQINEMHQDLYGH